MGLSVELITLSPNEEHLDFSKPAYKDKTTTLTLIYLLISKNLPTSKLHVM